MPRELKSFQLPKEWGGSDDDDQNSPRLFLKNAFSKELPISGGWGYSSDDCVIIDRNDPVVPRGLPFDGISVEYFFVEKRNYAELIIFRTQNDQYLGIDWKLDQQRLYTEGDRTFDVLEIRVTAFTDADWEYLANDWETNHQYENDEGGLKQHQKERLLRTCHYDAQFWFDITSFYGKSGIVE